MKPVSFLFIFLLTAASSFSQKPKITWGDEFKLHKGSTDLDVLYADKTGVYLQESHLALKSYFVIGASVRESATFIKLDNNLSEIYHNDFNKELKGKEFEEFFPLQNKIFIIASDYSKRDRALSVYGAEIDKSSGELASGWTPLITLQKDEKKDEIRFKIVPNSDSTKMVLVSSVEGKEKNTYQVQEFDSRLNPSAKPVVITNEFDPKTFQLQDVIYTNTRKILLVGRMYAYEEGKKKKNKFLDFVNYNIRLYDENGKQQTEVNTDINGKWLMSTKVFQKDDKDLVLTAFYSNEKRGRSIDGMLVERIDPASGNVLSTSEKEINNSLLTAAADSSSDEAADENETKAERKERERLDNIKDEGEGFSRYMKFRNIFYTGDGGIIILAEHFHHYSYTTSTYTPGTNGSGYWTNTTYFVYECGDILMAKIDAAGNLNWLKVLPKSQREVTSDGSSGTFYTTGFFDFGNRPFYAGFGAMQANGTISILFNDNPKNADVTQPGQRVKLTNRFGKSDCFIVSLDELTGRYTRNQFFSNADVPTAMPRLGSIIGDDMYITGKDDRIFAKTKIAVAKITVK